MSVVIELTDRAFAIARDGELLEASASIVRSGIARAGRAGEPMAGKERLAPTEVSSEHWARLAQGGAPDLIAMRTARAELQERLRRVAVPSGTEVEVAVPATLDARALGAVLSLLASVGVRVKAFRDAAVVTAAALNIAGDALVLELGLHHTAVTRVGRKAGVFARSGNRADAQQGGLIELQQLWLVLAAQALVLRTRFDPLHEAHTEQQLHDALPAALAQAALVGRTSLSVPGPDRTALQVELTRDQLALPVQPFIRANLKLLHSLRPAGATLTLVLPEALMNLPGTDSLLAEFFGCELLGIPDGYAAMALSAALARGAVTAGEAASDGSIPLMRRVPQGLAFAAAQPVRMRVGGGSTAATPTHVLYGGRALALGDVPLEIGRDVAGEHGLTLPEGLAGVSRLHCTIRREAAQIVVMDHSRYGSLVNGERVAGRAIVRAGDVLRLGDPGVELSLIAIDDPAALLAAPSAR